MYEAVAVTSQSVVYAGVGGFAEKVGWLKVGWLTRDYDFAVEVYWSDNRTTFVKRTYADFVQFHQNLEDHFHSKLNRGTIKTQIFIPSLEGTRWFRRNSRELAEQREQELHSFLKQLLKGNPLISGCQPVLDFFKSRDTDPIPAREPPEGANADDYKSFDNESDEDDILFNR